MDKKDSNGTVLVIDNDVSMRLLLKKVLGQEGYEVFCALDGEEGLEFVKERDVDLILLDHVLPGIQGMDVLRELRRKGMGIPVIIVTGVGTSALEAEANRLGVFGFVNKPAGLEGIKDMIKIATEGHRLGTVIAGQMGDGSYVNPHNLRIGVGVNKMMVI